MHVRNLAIASLLGAVCLGATACQDSVSAATEPTEAQPGSDVVSVQNDAQMTPGFPVTIEGALPDTPPSEAVQSQVSELLAQGMSDAAFEGLSDPETSMEGLGAGLADMVWERGPQGRVLYLVERHLRGVDVATGALPSGFACTGTLYSGKVAARPFTYRSVQSEAYQELRVAPYGLLVCEADGGLEMVLVEADHPLVRD